MAERKDKETFQSLDNQIREAEVKRSLLLKQAMYSNDPEEKRKGKVLDPITVPVLNEIKSETASIESQSNKNRDIGTELESTENIETDELL